MITGDDWRAPDPKYRWHSRGRLPHCDVEDGILTITIRLADAVPVAVIERLKHEVEASDDDMPEHVRDLQRIRSAKLRGAVEKYCDGGHGSCILREDVCAAVVEENLLYWDGDRYTLLAWAIMPNHVHCMIHVRDATPIGKIVASWKRCSAGGIKRALGERCPVSMRERGCIVWQGNYWDRFIRDKEHLRRSLDYIEQNPVKAGLVDSPGDWRWSSACRNRKLRARDLSREAPIRSTGSIP